MGVRNASAVYVWWPHLTHRDHRLLVRMALSALDDGQPPVYFGGWQFLAESLGLDVKGNPNNAKEAVRRALSRLVKAGAVVSSGHARTGRRAEYALTLHPELTARATGTAADRNGRTVTVWQVVTRDDGEPVDSPPP